MGNKVQIQVATEYDGSGVQNAQSDLDRYKQAIQDVQEEHKRRLAEAERFRHDLDTGQASQTDARRVLDMLDERVRRTRELVDLHGALVDRSKVLRQEQEQAIAQGNVGEVARLQRELEALAEVRKFSRRDPMRLEQDLYAERARVVRSTRDRLGIPQDPPDDTTPPGGGTGGQTGGGGGWGRGAFGLALFQAVRGMGPAEEEAKLRYQVAAPGVRPAGMGVDEFGMQLSEVGRAMAYSRQETLQAAVAYNRLAGTVGEQLLPEMKTLTEAARYHRMELTQSAEFFGSMRRLTRADDPDAMRMIATTVRATLESAGPYRRDDVRDAIRTLASRSTQGMPGGLTADTLLLHGTLAETLNRTGMPGMQGTAGADVLSRAFQLQFSADDPTSIMRMRMLQGRPDLLNGNIFNVLGESRLQLERIGRFQWNDEDIDAIFQMVQRSTALAGGGSLSKAGVNEALRRVGGLGPVTAHEMDALSGALLSGGQDQFRAEMQRLRERRDATTGVGPQQAQLDSEHVANERSNRMIRDALGTLGREANKVRNTVLGEVSDIFGGGTMGDMAALGLSTATQFGMLYGGLSTLRRIGGPIGRRIAGGGRRFTGGGGWFGAPQLFGGARGTRARGILGDWRGSTFRLNRLGPRAGLASRMRFLRRRVFRPNAGAIGAGLGLGAFALGGYLEGKADDAEGSRQSYLHMGAAGAQIAGYSLMGASMGGPIGAAGGAALGTLMNRKSLAEGIAGALPFSTSDALTKPHWRWGESAADVIADSDKKTERMSKDSAAIKLMKELYGDRYGEALNAYQLRRDDKVSAASAFQTVREKMEERGVTLSDAQRDRAARILSGSGEPAAARRAAQRRSMDINVNVNVTGNKEIGQAVGDRVADAIRETGIPDPDDTDQHGPSWSVSGGSA